MINNETKERTFGAFTLVREEKLGDLVAEASLWEHNVTGARILHVKRADKERSLAITLKTTSGNSTGVAHILEHTALCGSAKFPVRDPFFAMMGRSLSTFMNAFTSDDWTMYPFASQNKKDFYNLMSVYFDAVFHPVLDELSFKQEGWRLEFENNRPVYKGIVFNEMKGSLSTPSNLMYHAIAKALLPDTVYANISGGDPEKIIDLSWQDLKDFHAKHYHPSNAYFLSYGDFPAEEILTELESYLAGYERGESALAVFRQTSWAQTRYTTQIAPSLEGEGGQVAMAWKIADIQNFEEVFSFSLLSDMLLGNQASPLRRALLDSGLGSSLCDHAGYDLELRDTIFTVGLKDVKKGSTKAVEEVVLVSLEKIVKDGFDSDLKEAIISQAEFELKENDRGSYPQGLELAMQTIGAWIHGGDIFKVLQTGQALVTIKEKIKTENFFENLIKEKLLDNQHRAVVELEPCLDFEAKQQEKELAKLAELDKTLNEADRAKIDQDAKDLMARQDKKDDLSCLPDLNLEDATEEIIYFKPSLANENDNLFLYQDNDLKIFYQRAIFGLGCLKEDLLALVPFFCFIANKMGSQKRSFEDMSKAIANRTGSLHFSPDIIRRYGEHEGAWPIINLKGKCLEEKVEAMLELIKELVMDRNLGDLSRLEKLLIEYKSSLESDIVSSGHAYAAKLACRSFSEENYLSELWHGLHHFQLIKKLSKEIKEDQNNLSQLAQNLEGLASSIFNQQNCRLVLVGCAKAVDRFCPLFLSFRSSLPAGEFRFAPFRIELVEMEKPEIWVIPATVAFNALACKMVDWQDQEASALEVLAKILKTHYTHKEIREKGGAYGGYASYNRYSGNFVFSSYRDPSIKESLSVFGGAGNFMKTFSFGQAEIKEAVLKILADLETPASKASLIFRSFVLDQSGIGKSDLEDYKKRLLSLTVKDVTIVAEKYLERLGGGKIAVLAGPELTKKEADEKFIIRTI